MRRVRAHLGVVRSDPPWMRRSVALPGRSDVGLRKVGALSAVAILHEGRIKPMETFARHVLLQFSGRTRYEKQSALEVMARILFTPEMTGDYKIFLINNPEVVQAMLGAPRVRLGAARYVLSLHRPARDLHRLGRIADVIDPRMLPT